MKRLILTFFVFSIAQIANAQQDTIWRRGGLLALNFSQTSLSNWAAGGQNSVAGNAIVNYYANYKRGIHSWDNNLDLGFGYTMQGKDSKAVKNDDKMELTSKYGRQASKYWYYSLLLNFRSQFAEGFNYPNDSVVVSRFFAPAYITLALGMDYKPNDYFSLFLSPVAVRFIIVNDKTLSDAGAFGVDSGKMEKTQFGANIRATYKKDITATTNLQTSIDLFSNYLENPQNIEVNWQMLLAVKLSKLFSISFSAQLIYDDKTQLPFYKSDGVTVDHLGPRTQFKEVFGIGLAYKFSKVKTE